MDQSTTPRPGAGRRGLGTGLTIFLVVDVLLVLAVAVALAAYLSGGGSAGPDAGPAPSASAPAPGDPTPTPTPTGDDPAGPATFALPSGNIACAITDEAATCTIAESDAEPAAQEGCAGVVGPIVTVTAEGATTPCVQGALPGPAAPGTPTLEYGESTTVGEFTCTSSTTGVTCRHDPTEAGFSLARAGHQIL